MVKTSNKNCFLFTDATVIPLGVNECMQLQSVYIAGHDPIPLIFDTGATMGLLPLYTDFESWETPSGPLQLYGIVHSAKVKGVWTVCWTVCDDHGCHQSIRTQAYYIFLHLGFASYALMFTFANQRTKGVMVHFLLPTLDVSLSCHTRKAGLPLPIDEHRLPIANIVKLPPTLQASDRGYFNVLGSDNINLTAAQKELLQWQFWLGHFNLRWIQRLMRVREGDKIAEPIFPTKRRKVRPRVIYLFALLANLVRLISVFRIPPTTQRIQPRMGSLRLMF